MEKQSYRLSNKEVRHRAARAVLDAPDGYSVTIQPSKRSLDQNALLHSILSDIERSGFEWAGKKRSVEELKALFVSAHSVATGMGGEVVPGIEGEFVAIRERTSRMSVSRASSLIEYILAFCSSNGIEVRDGKDYGYL